MRNPHKTKLYEENQKNLLEKVKGKILKLPYREVKVFPLLYEMGVFKIRKNYFFFLLIRKHYSLGLLHLEFQLSPIPNLLPLR
jgi:hypothetical protein